MLEKDFEKILIKYPELIEDGLKLIGQQTNVDGKRVDLMFQDRHGFKLIVELKKGSILRKHIAQLMDYEGYFLSFDDPTVRVMLVGNRVPLNLQRTMDHHGFEWKEIKVQTLIKFLKGKQDTVLLESFFEQELKPPAASYKKHPVGLKTKSKTSSLRDENEQLLVKPTNNPQISQIAHTSRSRKMGYRTGNHLFGTRQGTMANLFCIALFEAGSKGLSMKEAKSAEWNPKRYHFNQTVSRLINEGIAEKREGRFYLTNSIMKDIKIIPPLEKSQILLCSADAGPKSQKNIPDQAGYFFPGAKWVGAIRNSANELGCDFSILTTGHGMVNSWKIIKPYDKHIDKHPDYVRANFERTTRHWLENKKYKLVVFYAGACPRKPYLKMLHPILEAYDVWILTYGKSMMKDVGKMYGIVKILTNGKTTSLSDIRSGVDLKFPEGLDLLT